VAVVSVFARGSDESRPAGSKPMLENSKPETTVDRAVSPVIGVVLIVGLTVILSAVVGSLILGVADDTIGDGPATDAPNASFVVTESGDELTITHAGGDAIEADRLLVDGDLAEPRQSWGDYGTIGEGDSMTVETTGSEPTVYVVWRGFSEEELLDRYDG